MRAAPQARMADGSGLRWGDRKRDDELAASADAVASRLHAAAVQLHDRFDERESDAETSQIAMLRAADLDEPLEDAVDHLRRDADAVVAYTDDGGARLGRGGHLDVSAFLLIFRRVVQQIADHLYDSCAVDFDDDGRW